MKIINNKLYIEWAEMRDADVPEGTLAASLRRKPEGWNFLNDPSDRRKTLIEYAPLKDRYKVLLTRRFGDPHEYVKNNTLNQFMGGRPEDIDFLQNYRLPNGKFIPKETLESYISGVKILHFCSLMAEKKRAKSLGIANMKAFWELVTAYITKTGASLPSNIKRLQEKLSEYKEQGPQCIVSRHFLNNRASKVDDELAEAYLLQLIGHVNRPDDHLVCERYNQWAVTMGLRTICPTTVWNYRHRNKTVVTLTREGKKGWSDQFARTKHRERPSIPLALAISDDNDVDLFFRDEKAGKKNYYKRVKMIVIIDAFNNYPLGWAVGEVITIDLVREAYANAIDHIYQMTGAYYVWHQLQADKWAKADLIPWYKQQAIFIEGRTGNSRARRIEPFFNHEWHRVIGMLPNYTGHNITRGISVNPEALEARKKDFPTLDKAHSLASIIIQELRTRKVSGNDQLTIQQQWMQAFNQIAPAQKRELNDINRLMWYGRKHQYTNTITKDGLIVTLNGNRIIYDVPLEEYTKHVGRTLNIAYSPYDPSKILAYSDDESIRIVCKVFEKFRDAVIDMQPGDRARLNQRLAEDDSVAMWASQKIVEQREKLAAAGIDHSGILLTQNLQKALNHSAQELMLVNAVTGKEEPETKNWDLNEATYDSYDPDEDI